MVNLSIDGMRQIKKYHMNTMSGVDNGVKNFLELQKKQAQYCYLLQDDIRIEYVVH